ncbi:MAG TPA: hypothetical protein VHC48_22640 [Puia sp.]|nr:hypothetical protein [Puia sp.]
MKSTLLLLLLPFFLYDLALASTGEQPGRSTQQEALAYLRTIRLADSSIYWPNTKGHLFLENLQANVQHPLGMYQGSNTNFCGYAAFSFLVLNYDPLQYVKFMLALYEEGQATWNKIKFTPSPEVMLATGTLHFKGILDIHHADQMWFLVLADHFRSYLNLFHRKFHAGSEDTFWAACNLGKFNRMIRKMMGYRIKAIGSDLIRPGIKDVYAYLQNAIQTGTTYLYVNNTYLHVKNHDKSRFSFPTHYLVLMDIQQIGDILQIIYWDYGGRTLRQVTPEFLEKIIFGVTYCLKDTHEE